jgi:Cu/Ag efflux pump CusA
MMKRLHMIGLRRPALVAAVAFGVLIIAAIQLEDTDVETLPEFIPPVVEVQTEALGLSAAEVEQLITVPLEADLLNGVAWLETIRSESIPGLSSIVMTFEPGTDVFRARQVVQERLTQAAGLPNVSRAPAMVQPLSSESRVMLIGLSSDELSLVEMSVLARWTIRPYLMGVDGVANVSVWGQRERQLQVLVDQDELVAADVGLLEVVKTTGNALWVSPLSFLEASTPGTGGFVDGPNQRIGIQHVLGIDGADDLADVTIEGHDGLKLGDVTSVVEDHQPLIGDAVVHDGSGLLLVIEKFPWSNTTDTTDEIESALEELAPGMAGIQVDADIFRPADYLERSLVNTRNAAVAGILLAALATFALLASWRAAMVVLIATVVSLAATALVLILSGNEINLLVLAALVLSAVFITDDAIGSTDGIGRRFARRGDDPEIVVDDIVGSRRSASYAAVALALALIPVFAMRGAAGEFLPTVALTTLLALAVSIIVNSTVTPAVGSYLLPREAPDSDLRFVESVRGGHQWLFDNFNRWRGAGFAGASALAVIGLAVVPTLDREFVPELRQTDVVIRLDGAPGTSLAASRRAATSAAAELGRLPDVAEVGALVGRAVLSDRTANVNATELWVKIDPDADYGKAIASIDEVIRGYPGFGHPGAVSYSNDRVDTVLRDASRDLVLRVYGENPETLGAVADEMVELVAGINGTENVRAEHPLLEPAVQIEVDLERAAQHEIKPGDVRRTAATLLSGIEVGSFFEKQKVFEVVVWSPPEMRDSVTAVEQLLIETPGGDRVALSEVADVRVAPVQNVINRDAVSRYVDVTAEVSGRSLGDVEADITAAVNASGLPFEYHVRVLDEAVTSSSSLRRVVAIAAGVAIAIVLLLQAAFASWRLALLLFVVTPLALAGGLVALAVGGGTYSIGSAIGLFAIYGLTLRHALRLVDEFDTRQLDHGEALGEDLVRAGLGTQIQPILATLGTLVVAAVPFVVLGPAAGLEVLRPFAIVVLGGLLTSAIVTLFVLPAVYAQVARPAIARTSFEEDR